jgi:aspartate/methionine/tyrosine aminotransferase
MTISLANRLSCFKSNVFAEMDQAKQLARSQGQQIIDLSLGSSDLAVSPKILETMHQSLDDPTTHGYLLFHGTRHFREAAVHWYHHRFGLTIDPETEVLPLIGSQEGTAHLPLAVLNPGDIALLLDPGYPSHLGGVHLAGAEAYCLPLTAANQFLPDFEAVPVDVLDRSRMLVLSYPHNPTTAVADLDFFKQAVAFCQQHGIVLVHDFPYVDLVFGDYVAPSALQADPQRSCTIEFFTFSKSYNMGGFRIGFAIGNADLIRGLRQVKAIVDFNQYQGILNGAVTALSHCQEEVTASVRKFQQRRDAFIEALHQIGWRVPIPQATMYVWAPLPEPWKHNSVGFCHELVMATGIAASPGSGFGQLGEGYVRFALVQDPPILQQAVWAIGQFLNGC